MTEDTLKKKPQSYLAGIEIQSGCLNINHPIEPQSYLAGIEIHKHLIELETLSNLNRTLLELKSPKDLSGYDPP